MICFKYSSQQIFESGDLCHSSDYTTSSLCRKSFSLSAYKTCKSFYCHLYFDENLSHIAENVAESVIQNNQIQLLDYSSRSNFCDK